MTQKEFLDLILGLLEDNSFTEESDLLHSELMAYAYLDKDRVVRYLETLMHDSRPVHREFAALNLFFLSDGPNSQSHKILANYLGEELKEGEEVNQILKRYDDRDEELIVEATSTSTNATLQVFVTSTNQLIGTLRNDGGGRYSGTFSRSSNPQNITVRSSLGGSASRNVSSR